MEVVRAVERILENEVGKAVSEPERRRMASEAVELLSAAMVRSRPAREESRTMEMMVGMRSTVTVGSLGWVNLSRFNPTDPRQVNNAIGAGIAFITGGRTIAFVAAVMLLASRAVPRAEAMTLHLAWRIAGANRFFTAAEVIAQADRLRDDYGVDKVSDTDIHHYLNTLALAGSLRGTPRGYELVEQIYLAPI